jgi:tetratricopeptide (TPR) repeat protein
MITRESRDKEQDRQSAEEHFRVGVQAYDAGDKEQAVKSFGNAESAFCLVGDFKRAGDSRAVIATIEHQNGLLEQSSSSYRRAIQLYRDAGRTGDEAESLLALGHVERHLGHLEQAHATYLMVQSLYQSLQQVQGLGHVALALGHIALQRAHLEEAAYHYQEAIGYFRAAADETEADALSSLANVQRLMGCFCEAEANYRLVLEKYRTSEDVTGLINTLTDLGRLYLDVGQLDQASQVLVEALEQVRSAEYELGESGVNLGLAEIDLRQNRVDQALLEAQAALQTNAHLHYDLGIANAERLLAETYLQLGQLSYASSLMEQAIRLYTTLSFQRGLAKALVGLGEIQRRRGFLSEAIRAFQQGREKAHRLGMGIVESRALLGLGDSYRELRQLELAKQMYLEARVRAAHPGTQSTQGAIRYIAEAELRLTSLAMLAGNLDEAATHLDTVDEMIKQHALSGRVVPLAAIGWGHLLQARGDVTQAETCFREAHKQAEAVQDPLLAAEAMLGLAYIQRACDEQVTTTQRTSKGEPS